VADTVPLEEPIMVCENQTPLVVPSVTTGTKVGNAELQVSPVGHVMENLSVMVGLGARVGDWTSETEMVGARAELGKTGDSLLVTMGLDAGADSEVGPGFLRVTVTVRWMVAVERTVVVVVGSSAAGPALRRQLGGERRALCTYLLGSAELLLGPAVTVVVSVTVT
jgi:hypothetical protein